MDKKKSLKKLMDYAGGFKYLTYASWLLSAVSAVLALFPFIYIWRIADEIIKVYPDYSKAENIVAFGILALIFALLSVLTYFFALICSHMSAFRVATNIRHTAVRCISRLPIGYIGEAGTGKLRRIISDTSAASETYLAHQLPDLICAFVTPFAMAVMLFVFDWRFGLISLVPVLISFGFMSKMAGPQMAKDMKAYQDALEDMNNEAVEYIRGIPVIKTFGQTVFSFKRFKASIDNYNKFCLSYTKQCRAPMLKFTVAMNSTFAFLIAITLILVNGGANFENILVNLIFYVIFTPIITTTMTKVMYMGEARMTVFDALERIDALLSEKPLEEYGCHEIPSDSSVEFKNVSFTYKNARKKALDGVSFTAHPGCTTALVGMSGSGKTTAAALISRFWDVDGGEVRIGGVNVKNISAEILSDTVSYVFQDSRLLKTSIFENVRLSRPDASEAEVAAALHAAQCDDIIKKLPDGINTVIGSKGVYLSGGEQQRIAIARAILKDSPIIVLDEATAFADPENESLVQKAFMQLAKNKTVIMIAHRLTTVENADCIYVLEDGRVAAGGKHAQLLKSSPLYRQMYVDYKASVSWKVGENHD